MNETINAIFGTSIMEKSFPFPQGTPGYIKHGYEMSCLEWNGQECLVASPKDSGWRLPSLKKQIGAIERLCGLPVIANLGKITAMQRTNLIESGIAFVAGTGQVFIPFWGCYFEKKIKNPIIVPKKMTANAQLIFLYLYYRSMDTKVRFNLTQIAGELKMAKSTCTRAIQVLEGLELLQSENEGTAKWVTFSNEPTAVLNMAWEHMSTPVNKTVYVSRLPEDASFKKCGIKALAERTMLSENELDGGYAADRDQIKSIRTDFLIEKQQFDDFGGETIEVWKYAPFLLSQTNYVDDISLVLSLDDDTDERIQNELDSLREKYGINGGKR